MEAELFGGFYDGTTVRCDDPYPRQCFYMPKVEMPSVTAFGDSFFLSNNGILDPELLNVVQKCFTYRLLGRHQDGRYIYVLDTT